MTALEMSPHQIREHISRLKNKRPREVRAYFNQVLKEKQCNRSLAQSCKIKEGTRYYNSDWRKIVPGLADESVKLFIADPPYINDGQSQIYISARQKTNGLRADSDNCTSKDALGVTLPLFEECLPRLAVGGVLLLFQTGAKPISVEILTEADKQGWQCDCVLTWNKGHTITGRTNCPYRTCTDRIMVYCRRGEKIERHENVTASSDILDFLGVTRSSYQKFSRGINKLDDIHMFQKPLLLMEFLIKQHTFAGEMVCDLFGCSGSACIAAAQLNRPFIYIESNKRNYDWGKGRIQNAISEMSSKAG